MKSSIILGLLVSSILGEIQYIDQRVLECKNIPVQQAKSLVDLDVWGNGDNKDTFLVRVKNSKEQQIIESITSCKVKISNLSEHVKTLKQAELNNLNKASTADPFFNNYQSYSNINNALKQWANQYPDYATLVGSIGKSVEGRDILAFKITNKKSTGAKKAIYINGGIHAREWISPATTMYTIKTLLEQANSSAVQDILNNFEFHFTPLSNPDGYEYTRTNDRLWRKNRSVNSNGSYGTDLNRNWDDHWGLVGSSTNPNSETYQGRGPNSEPEIKALANYILNIPNRYGGIDFHSYGQLVLRNWGWTTQKSKNEVVLKKIGDAMKSTFASKGYSYTSQTGADLYPASGATDDWMASKAKMVSFTIELCPGSNSSVGFQLPASEIVRCADAAYNAVLTFAQQLKVNPNIPPNN